MPLSVPLTRRDKVRFGAFLILFVCFYSLFCGHSRENTSRPQKFLNGSKHIFFRTVFGCSELIDYNGSLWLNWFIYRLDILFLCSVECLTSFLELVVAGIAGSPHMISATVISVSRVVYEFRSKYSAVAHNVIYRPTKVVSVSALFVRLGPWKKRIFWGLNWLPTNNAFR